MDGLPVELQALILDKVAELEHRAAMKTVLDEFMRHPVILFDKHFKVEHLPPTSARHRLFGLARAEPKLRPGFRWSDYLKLYGKYTFKDRWNQMPIPERTFDAMIKLLK